MSIIRILPMDKINEFNGNSISFVQNNFFLKDVPFRVVNNEQGIYCFKSNKIKIDKNNIDVKDTYILFQYDNHIIACAKLIKIIPCVHNTIYKGYYVLEPNTIMIFDKISLNDLNTYMFPLEPIKRFSQVCHKRTIQNINSFLNNINLVKNEQFMDKTVTTLNYKFQC